MKELLRKITLFNNVIGLFYVGFYMSYVFINWINNKGNQYVNIALLVLSVIYTLLYIYSAFIGENSKLKKTSKKMFSRGKKILGFINALLIVTSVAINDVNSLLSIVIAVITMVLYVIGLIVDILISIIVSKIKRIGKRMWWKNDNRN